MFSLEILFIGSMNLNSDGKQVFENRYRGQQAQFTLATLAEHFELISELNRQFGTYSQQNRSHIIYVQYPEISRGIFRARA